VASAPSPHATSFSCLLLCSLPFPRPQPGERKTGRRESRPMSRLSDLKNVLTTPGRIKLSQSAAPHGQAWRARRLSGCPAAEERRLGPWEDSRLTHPSDPGQRPAAHRRQGCSCRTAAWTWRGWTLHSGSKTCGDNGKSG
jgi:hypothetical protein